MKNQEKSKPTKKKILTYYLILAAVLLVAAAVTLGVVFGIKGPKVDNIIDNPNPPPQTDPGEDNKPEVPPIVDTSTSYVFIVPIKNANLTQTHTFAYNKTLDWYRLHEGMDFSANAGESVLAAVDGTVKEVTRNDVLYGASVTIEHAGGITTVYKFIDPVETLKAGDKVSRGDVIGTVAVATGVENKEGDHLHFEVYKNGKIQDPDDFLDITSK